MDGKIYSTIVSFSLLSASLSAAESELSPEDIAFFESKIRPLLIDNCYKCHSADSEKVRGGVLLDSQPGMLRGGDSGPAIVPGDASQSRLIQMIERHPGYEAMPPKSKLERSEIDTLIAWIDRGAPDTRLEETNPDAALSDFNLEERKRWWSLQPISSPSIPEVNDLDWPSNEYDRFILSKLEEKGWEPAEPAERNTLLRRLSFDLTGLAPTPEELESFLSDDSDNAYEKQVDRLLASPHFGEKWARHWMDLVRYAETKAFEMDYTMPYAYRYRDYLIKAFNEDVPYDQFIKEALAGDLVPDPRIDSITRNNESVMGPGFMYLTDGQHGPPDLHEDEARIFDRMIDVTSKAFLGSTLACARCHDHKFDAITTADYYSFYGLLRSSRLSYVNTVPVEDQIRSNTRLRIKKTAVRKRLHSAALPDVEGMPDYLAAVREIANDPSFKEALNAHLRSTGKKKGDAQPDYPALIAPYIDERASERQLDPTTLQNWGLLALVPDGANAWPELEALVARDRTRQRPNPPQSAPTSETFASVAKSTDGWKAQGIGFQRSEERVFSLILDMDGEGAVQTIVGQGILAGEQSGRISGALRSPDFIVDGKPITLRAKGRAGTIRLVIRNYELAGRGPTTAKLYHAINGDHWQTITMDTYLWEGETAYLEILQNGEATHSIHPRRDTATDPVDNAYIAVRFGESPDWESYWEPTLCDQSQAEQDLAIAAKVKSIWGRARFQRIDDNEIDILAALFGAGLLRADTQRSKPLRNALSEYRSIAKALPKPQYARSLVDGNPHNEPVYIRGSHNNLSSEPNPRRFLDALGGTTLESEGSGRLQWAEHVASPNNPLTARVHVNRIWKHLFGAGIVETTNDFGQMGSAPSHPALLDYMANDFVANQWSMKAMIRKMVTTSAYRMSSTPSSASATSDPKNRLLQRMPVKRLEAELIREHILASSGTLDTSLFGPSVPAYVEDLPDSRAKPASGPIDGNGRRSVYLEMRRNFLPTFLRAFDMPNATEPIGRRNVTNVPAQSLALMNDPFVHKQARAWAESLVNSYPTREARVEAIHLAAFSRSATPMEHDWAKRFIESLANEYNAASDDPSVWADLCHVIYNRKEFIYVY